MSQHYIISAIGSYVLRGTNPIYIKDYAMARALFALQDEKYAFKPVPSNMQVIDGVLVPRAVHMSDNVCTSCEG